MRFEQGPRRKLRLSQRVTIALQALRDHWSTFKKRILCALAAVRAGGKLPVPHRG